VSSITRELANLNHANVETIRESMLRGVRSVDEVVKLRKAFASQMVRADRKILFALTRQLYEDEVAGYLLTEIIRHMETLDGLVGRPVSIKVAALDYFETVETISDRLELIHEDQIRKLAEMAIVDMLTGAFSREFFDYRLAEEVVRSRRYGRPLSLLMLDIDHFKQYNDTHGHPAGDELLRGMGELMRGTKRDSDLLYRYGGEEFTLLLPVTSLADAAQDAERIRAAVAQKLTVTVSIGAAELSENQEGADLLQCADERLYMAKNSGRNRVVTEG